jgi:predicted NBD/HSP70 family sugar kinase
MANGIEMRKFNRNLVYRVLLSQDEMSKQEIARATGLSLPTVTQNLQELVEKGLVEETGILESTGGRRAAGFRCIRNARSSVGIDITQHHIRIAVVNLAGEVLCESERERFQFRDDDECYTSIADKVKAIVEETAVDTEGILGVGLSVPSIVDRSHNRLTYSRIIDAPADVARKLEKRLPFHVEVYNDANAAGYAELYETDTQDGHEELCFYLMLSNSVGGAIINNSEIYLGYNGRSAEIGHVRIVPDGKECYCGQKGCVNAYCSAKILSQETDGELEVFFNELEKGNEKYRQLFREYLRYLAITIINIRMICDGLIIVGGYVGAYMKDYMEDLKKMCAELDPYSNSADYLKPCSFTHDASAVGAALYFVGDFINNL